MNPTVGRWLDEDPTGFKAGDVNLYRYVGNDATNDIDPSGLKLEVAGKVVTPASDIYKTIVAQSVNSIFVRSEILNAMIESKVENKTYSFKTESDFRSEVALRLNIIAGARTIGMRKSKDEGRTGLYFSAKSPVFVKWWPVPNAPMNWVAVSPLFGDGTIRTGVAVKPGAKPSAAMNEFAGWKGPIGFDCTSCTSFALQSGILATLGPAKFDELYKNRRLIIVQNGTMDYVTMLPPNALKLVQQFEMAAAQKKSLKPVSDLIPGDLRIFYNPKGTGNLIREITVYLGQGEYFAWPWGVLTRQQVIDNLTELTKQQKSIIPAAELPISIRPSMQAIKK